MIKLTLIAVLAIPNRDCLRKAWADFNKCVATLMMNCKTPDTRPTIDYVREFAPGRDDRCYEIYLSSVSFDAVLKPQEAKTPEQK